MSVCLYTTYCECSSSVVFKTILILSYILHCPLEMLYLCYIIQCSCLTVYDFHTPFFFNQYRVFTAYTFVIGFFPSTTTNSCSFTTLPLLLPIGISDQRLKQSYICHALISANKLEVRCNLSPVMAIFRLCIYLDGKMDMRRDARQNTNFLVPIFYDELGQRHYIAESYLWPWLLLIIVN